MPEPPSLTLDGASDVVTTDRDADGDGYDAAEWGGADCDDADATIHPGAAEFCDGVDNDCTGVADDGDLGPAWYTDADGDGFGDDATADSACTAPNDTVDSGGDCDDTDATVHPGAVEVCGDGIDGDCDGHGCFSSGSLSSVIEYAGVGDNDWAGSAAAGAGDTNGDGFDDLLIGAYGNSLGGQFAGAAYLVLGGASPHSASLSTALQFTGEAASDYAGSAVAGAGDVDGDGLDDVLIGAVDHSEDVEGQGVAYLVLGGVSQASGPLTNAIQYLGISDSDWVGGAVAAAGDVDADGHDDFLIGAIGNSDRAYLAGAAYLVLGAGTRPSGSLSLAVEYTGEHQDDRAGTSLAGAGDVDGDGYDDVIIGAYGCADTAEKAGAAYLLLGTASPASDSLATAIEFQGEAYWDLAGYGVGGGGDVNGDGFDDVVVGAPYNSDASSRAGAFYLVLGSTTPVSASLSNAIEYTGEADDEDAGRDVEIVGDVDGDGYADMLAGAGKNGDAATMAGAAYLVYGLAHPASASLSSAIEFTGEAYWDGAGMSVARAGDANGDGLADMLVGAPLNDDGGSKAGAGYLILGGGW